MSDNTQPEHKPGVYEAEQVYRQLNPVQGIPYRCPVCYGKGVVPPGFYDVHIPGVVPMSRTTATPETCRGCGGTGVIR